MRMAVSFQGHLPRVEATLSQHYAPSMGPDLTLGWSAQPRFFTDLPQRATTLTTIQAPDRARPTAAATYRERLGNEFNERSESLQRLATQPRNVTYRADEGRCVTRTSLYPGSPTYRQPDAIPYGRYVQSHIDPRATCQAPSPMMSRDASRYSPTAHYSIPYMPPSANQQDSYCTPILVTPPQPTSEAVYLAAQTSFRNKFKSPSAPQAAPGQHLNRTSFPPPLSSPDIYPIYHPSVVTPCAVPDEFATRLPHLTFHPRGPSQALYRKTSFPAADAVPSFEVTTSQRFQRSGRTPLSTSRAFFRRTSRPTRPAPRRAELKDCTSPRASSLEPPRSKDAALNSELKHQRAVSACLPGVKAKNRALDSVPLLSTTPSPSKRPSRVPPLPLAKLLQSRSAQNDHPPVDVRQDGARPLRPQTYQLSTPAQLVTKNAPVAQKRELGRSGSRQSPLTLIKVLSEPHSEWLLAPRTPSFQVDEAEQSQHLMVPSHWHSRQPTLNGQAMNSQRYMFVDVHSARTDPPTPAPPCQPLKRKLYHPHPSKDRGHRRQSSSITAEGSSLYEGESDEEEEGCPTVVQQKRMVIQQAVRLELGPGARKGHTRNKSSRGGKS
eukprot:Blabericola_migrator_1__5328@NODE_2732_length_2414_cov_104_867916_g449_i2_p1_GENE_NODE_2732_length_2414_cov_104_867916_g449_i2NODE_2732_length_2414_cov_104_867916_g449_i2_p1_ORF_typecomplete_len607_score22_37_NODE_2732_length_2414_cov_104_867916_g449_i24852305